MRVGKEAVNPIAHQTPIIHFGWNVENIVSISKLQFEFVTPTRK